MTTPVILYSAVRRVRFRSERSFSADIRVIDDIDKVLVVISDQKEDLSWLWKRFLSLSAQHLQSG